MSYQTLYLKYRPQSFDQVAGQNAIVRTLKNALVTGKMAHAYLFAGPRGTGKTTMARLFAKALNCDEGTGHQCNECESCKLISEGSHPDVIEIDAASNNGVDQVRDLIDKIRYSPVRGKYKIYIIDEVHMMSAGAFNALLKTLEEPPENVMFILCTTEPYKVLPTILSRCQRFDFGKISPADMKEKLIEVLKTEGATYTESSLDEIISLADGGMRDALSILDQSLAFSDNNLNEKDVLSIFGIASNEEKIMLLKKVNEGDVQAIIKRSEEYVSMGLDIRRLVSDLIEILKDALVYSRTKEAALLTKIKEEHAIELTETFVPSFLNKMIDSLVEAQQQFKNVSDVRSLFELTLLRLCADRGGEEQPLEIKTEKKPVSPAKVEQKPTIEPKKEEKPASKIIEEDEDEEDETNPPEFLFDGDEEKAKEPKHVEEEPKPVEEPKPAPKVEAPKPEPVPVKPLDTSSVHSMNIVTEGVEYELPDDEIIKILVAADKDARTKLIEQWPSLAQLKTDSKLGKLAALLSDAKPYAVAEGVVVLAYGFTRRKKEANIMKNQEPLSELLQAIYGKKVFVYALDRIDINRITTRYYNLKTVNQLPDKKTLIIKLPIQ